MQLVGFSLLFGREGCSQQSYSWILGRERRQEHAVCFGKTAPFSLLVAFIPLLNAKGVFGGLDKVVPIPLLGYLGHISIPILP
jgi:hypothetical protein